MKIFITGANRGIGLEFVRQYLANGDTVFAAARKPDEATELNALKSVYPDTLIPVQIDLIDDATIIDAAQSVREHTDSLDVLINNAGINPPGKFQEFGALDSQGMLFMLHVNTVAPLMVVQAFIDLLKAGDNPRVVNVSSQVGSFDWKRNGGSYGYAPSKSALNMVTNLLGYDLKPMGITAITTHPGWVQTDMGGPNASLTPEESVSGLITLIDGLTTSDAGKFYKWNGEQHEW
ncbi:MAG: SDR family oxidoreductase [Aggregatilineales bacterium]